jgi:hypothetical protein
MKLTRFLWTTIGFLIALAALSAVQPVRADEIPIGFIGYSSYQYDSNGNVVSTTFSINNLTGDPALAGFALPPDFPVLTFLDINNATLTLEGPSAPSSPISLGTIAPGPFLDGLGNPLTLLQFAAGSSFTSALLQGTLSSTTVTLSNGTTVTLEPTISAILLPSAGSTLTPDLDLTLIDANTAAVPTPEPESLSMVLCGVLCLFLARLVRGSGTN